MIFESKQLTFFSAALCVASNIVPSMLSAEEDVTSLADPLPAYVVVATRTPVSLDRVSPSVSFIGEDEIEFWQDRSLVDSISRIPGVATWSNGTPGSLTSLSIRGSESNHTSFFLDGRRLNPGFGNQYDLESLAVQNLASVQVQSGASSVNYGASGIGGAVALQSKSTLGGDGLSGDVSLEVGANAYRNGSVSALYSEDNWGFSIGASQLKTDNERENDDFERESLQGRFDYELFDDFTFELVGQYSDAEKGAAGVITNPKLEDRQWTTNWLLSPGVRYATDVITMHLFYSRSESRIDNDIEDFFGSIYQTENKVGSDEVNLQVDYTFSDDALFTFGAVYRNDHAENPNLNSYSSFVPVLPYENRFEQTGLWSQIQWQLSSSLEVRAGLRYDRYSDYDSSVNGNVEAIYHFTEDSSVFVKVATSYSPPSALDLAFDEDQALVDDGLGGEMLVANTTILNPEESVSYELGFEQELLDDQLKLAVVFFRNEIDELITYESLVDVNDPFDFFDDDYGSDTLNVEEATTEGVELSIDYAATDKVDLGLSYTYLTATNDSEDQRLAYRPRHQLQLSATFRPVENLSFGLSALGQFDRERGQYLQPNLDVEDYFVVNLVSEWTINEEWSLFARVGNLLDEDYASVFGYPALGRAGYIGARFEF
ncbi:TonB-dependent receptor [Coraliomargarita algicola]|uniref:TonB-dependent receptor n=1 Tax=Coraliomargarita algicola TaxID=3092156 RepID=A0ABZ0RH61_9BACT|nr:TonB-dependent receptor [Coraliomargarita sp. J2-16]WPJ95520.1 TonB-dependent receptor [Coraliomargarita sp. J2-16]